VHLGDHGELVGVLEIEQQFDGTTAPADADGFAPNDGRQRRETLLPVE